MSSSRLWGILVLVAAAGVLAGLTRSAHASYPGANDAIAYEVDNVPGQVGAISMFDPSTGKTAPLVTAPVSEGFARYSVAWSSEGDRLAWAQSNSPASIFVLEDDHSVHRLTAPYDRVSTPKWTPTGTAVVYGCHGDSVCEINSDGTDPRVVLYGDRDTLYESPALSPDGRQVAFINGNADPPVIQIVHLAERGHVVTIPVGDDSFCADDISTQTPAVAWSPDGKQLAYCEDEAVTIVDIGTGHSRVVANDGRGTPSWSPDGTELVYPSLPHPGFEILTVVKTDGTDEHVLRDTAGDPVYGVDPDWRRTPTPLPVLTGAPPSAVVTTMTTPTTTQQTPPGPSSGNGGPSIRTVGASIDGSRLALALTACDDRTGPITAGATDWATMHGKRYDLRRRTWTIAGQNGCVTAHRSWRIVATPGTHVVALRVHDARGVWSAPVRVSISVSA